MNGCNWISGKIDCLKKLAEKAEYEDTLLSYIACMMRLLNGLSQIQVSSFHQYENIILASSMRIFCGYFIEEVEEALDENDPLQKELDIRDIEDAICALNDIYENVINGTVNSDKQMLMSMPVNSSTYGISPKLYAAYEELVSRLVEVYAGSGSDEYAFLLNPTLKNVLYAETLFRRRKKSGKVVIIHMPVRLLEKTNQIPLYLIHEVFHVLTKQERKRKTRARCLMEALLMQVWYCLFEDVSFNEDEKVNKQWKMKLFDLWTQPAVDKYVEKVKSLNELDRFFYSENIKGYISGIVEEMLQKIETSFPKDIGEQIYYAYIHSENVGFDAYDRVMQEMMQQTEIIERNIWRMNFYRLIAVWTEELMFLFRESYADLACLLTSKYTLDQYKEAFKESVRFKIKDADLDADSYYQMRQKLMYAVFIEKNIRDTDESKSKISVKLENAQLQEDTPYDIIVESNIFNIYMEYLNLCKDRLNLSMSKRKGQLYEFEQQMKKFRNMDSELVLEILVGDI